MNHDTPPDHYELESPFEGSVTYSSDSLWTPTPLDPYATRRNALNYELASHNVLENRVKEKAHAIGLDAHFSDIAFAELEAALHVRVERNNKSYERLKRATEGKALDDTMVDIITKARSGSADTQELLRLIKEYPDMISLEFFKRTTPFDFDEYRDAYLSLQRVVNGLRVNFYDADISVDFDRERIASPPFITDHSGLVRKDKIGEAKSADSHIEIIAKHSMIILPASAQLNVNKKQIFRFTRDGKSYNCLPLGISAYFRTVDYKDRPGYSSPEGEHRSELSATVIHQLGDYAVHHSEILEKLPEDMRMEYLRGVQSFPDDATE